ncbi:MAG TPA: WYL domain-containing protein, partial [Cryptosporangiaceae bacterium]|nr:WYL domain-containing protein [Cryptosporangiaceae bacterium]
IDMSLDEDTVTITYHAGMDRPLRLTADEALALIVALRAVGEAPGLGGRDVVQRALAKLESAAGDAAGAADRVTVSGYSDDEGTAEAVRGALDRGRALRIVYYTAGRDATTERVVDPIRLLLVGGQAYLEAWCRRVEAVRRFRLDRIDALDELDEPSAPPPVDPPDLRGGLFQPAPESPLVRLRVGRGSRWVTEYYPCEQVEVEADGRWLVALRASDLEWARRLVMGLGDDVEVVAPPELVERVRAEARTALAAYQPGSTVR